MAAKERRYGKDMLLLMLGCAVFGALLYGLLTLLNGANRPELLSYVILAGSFSFFFVTIYSSRVERRIWGEVLEKQRKKRTFLHFLLYIAGFLALDLLFDGVQDFAADLMIEHRYPGISQADPNFFVILWEMRRTVKQYLTAALLLILIPPTLVCDTLFKFRLHREKEQKEAEGQMAERGAASCMQGK